jgi:transposase
MRIVGLDVSRSVAEIAYPEDGMLQADGRAGLRRDELERFAAELRATDHVVLEATGNTAVIVNVLRSHVARVAIANSLLVRLIAEARVKTDKIDAAVLAQLYASHFLPEVWMPDESTLALRQQVSRRSQLVRQRTRLKNEAYAVLAAHLIERCPATDLFGRKGCVSLNAQPLPMDERLGVEQRLRELDRLSEDLHEVDRALAQASIGDERLRRLLTITGVDTTVAIGLRSAIGAVERFLNPEKLVSYFGLNASVYQSGPTPASWRFRSQIKAERTPKTESESR